MERKQQDYIEELTAPRMRNIRGTEETDQTADTEEQQPLEDKKDKWSDKNQSALTGRMSGTMEELERIQSCEMMYSDEVQECLKDTLDCYQSCTETTMRCLEAGGKLVEHEHINLLLDCAKICSTNADFIVRDSTYYPQTCGICADICDECSEICDRFEDEFMKECASICRRCAESCREMAR